MKKCFIEGPETHPDILRGGHRNPYQFKNAIKSGGTVFCLLGLNSLPGSCEWLTINQDLSINFAKLIVISPLHK